MIVTMMRHGISDRNIMFARHKERWMGELPTSVPVSQVIREHDSATRLAPAANEYIQKAVQNSNLPSFDITYVSPYRRTLETLREVRNITGDDSPIIQEQLIVERDWGIHDISKSDEYGYLETETLTYVSSVVHGGFNHSDFVKTVNGESHTDVITRASAFWNLLINRYGSTDKKIFVVSHAEFLGELARIATEATNKFHFSNSEILTYDMVNDSITNYDPIRDRREKDTVNRDGIDLLEAISAYGK